MAKVKVKNWQGKEVEEIELSKAVFSLPKNDDLVHQVLVALESNSRQVLAHTKTRGERAGSGIKPWRQKGTGRARVGSVRTPVWRKGGIVFGPRNERNYSKKINKKMISKALQLVLGGKLQDGEMVVVDKFDFSEMKTKQASEGMKNLKIKGSALVAFSKEEKDFSRIFSNLEKVGCANLEQVNVKEILGKKNLILSKKSLLFLEEKYSKKDKSDLKKQ